MENCVKIITTPIKLPHIQLNKNDSKLRFKIAEKDLLLAKESIERTLKYNIPIYFNFEIKLTLSINTTSFKIKIDYSEISNVSSRKLIKLYLSGDRELFAQKWLKL